MRSAESAIASDSGNDPIRRQSIAEVSGSVTGIPCATHGSKPVLSRRRIVEEGFDAHFDTM